MPRIDTTMLKGLSGAEIAHSERYVGEERLQVSVLNEYGAFDEFVNGMYDAMNARWEMYHHGENFPVTSETYLRYPIRR